MMDKTDNTLLWPFPDHRHLYMIAAGLVLGILLGPAVFGRLAPARYDATFVGSGDALAERDAYDALTAERLEQLTTTGVSVEAAAEQLLAERQTEAYALDAQLRLNRQLHAGRLGGIRGALVAAILALMLIETMLITPPQGAGGRTVPTALGRLTTARYALAAVLIALALAQPAALKSLPLGFVATVTLAAAAFALVPLGKHKTSGGCTS